MLPHRDTASSRRRTIGRLHRGYPPCWRWVYSWGAIAASLSAHGLAVSKSVLQGYLRPPSPAAVGTFARPRGGGTKAGRRAPREYFGVDCARIPEAVAALPVQRETSAAKPAAKEAVVRCVDHRARHSGVRYVRTWRSSKVVLRMTRATGTRFGSAAVSRAHWRAGGVIHK